MMVNTYLSRAMDEMAMVTLSLFRSYSGRLPLLLEQKGEDRHPSPRLGKGTGGHILLVANERERESIYIYKEKQREPVW